MQLYHSPTSPFVRKVMAVLHDTGLGPQVRLIPAGGTPVAPGTMPLDKNPLGKIPTLVLDNGQALYDSRVICRYLDDLAGGGLYPQDRLWQVLTLEALADGMMEAAVLMVYETRLRPKDKRFADWVEGQWTKIARALGDLEENWMDHLSGTPATGPVDMGQTALGCALGYLDFRHDARAWRTGHPRLAAWHSGFGNRPAMQTTVPV